MKNRLWRHKKRGTLYKDLFRATLVSDLPIDEGATLFAYTGGDKQDYCTSTTNPKFPYVVGHAEAELQAGQPIVAGDVIVFYQSLDNDKIWCLPEVEFDDGRFEAAPTSLDSLV
jgi:hypothetical protein